MDIFHQSFLKNYLIKDYEILNNFVFFLKVLQPLMATAGVRELCSLLAVFILANSVDPDEMWCFAAFHLGLHCLPKYEGHPISSLTMASYLRN